MEKTEAEVPRKASQIAVEETAAKKPIMAGENKETTEQHYTVRTEHVPGAVAEQEDDDQDGHEDLTATATQDKGDGAGNIPAEEIQTRPRKPPDTGCVNLKRINRGLLMTGILLIHLMLRMNPMITISGPVLMDTSCDDNAFDDIEYEFVYTEKDTMGDVGVIYMDTVLGPTGGLDNILRFKKNVDS